MKIWQRIKNRSIYPGAYIYLSFLSRMNQVKSVFKKDTTFFEKSYAGQKILLVALFEKGALRADIENLLAIAKRHGAYVIAVNTLKLHNPERYSELMDCYIERYNFGRDFGSYKRGVAHLYERQWHEKCSRLLMLNDSLFYSRNNLNEFILNLLETKTEVLGATENHEIEHHLGSFCLSINGDIVRDSRFKRYWEEYANSDIRPIVIKRGEMQFSQTLRKCVTTQDNFCALFDIAWFSEYINSNKEFLDHISDFYRTPDFYRPSDFVDWKRPSLKTVAERLISRRMLIDPGLACMGGKIEAQLEEKAVHFVDHPDGLQRAIVKTTKEVNQDDLTRRIYEEVKSDLLECFSAGSQIHQNAIMLHYLGLPMIKLDGLYRGMFSVEDIEKLAQQLAPDEVMLFKRLMYSKPFGANVLFGWKRAAFYRGLI